jgi:hypothetical protein
MSSADPIAGRIGCDPAALTHPDPQGLRRVTLAAGDADGLCAGSSPAVPAQTGRLTAQRYVSDLHARPAA